MKHVCIFLHPLVGADILFQQVLEPKSEIVFSNFSGQAIGGSVCTIDNQQR